MLSCEFLFDSDVSWRSGGAGERGFKLCNFQYFDTVAATWSNENAINIIYNLYFKWHTIQILHEMDIYGYKVHSGAEYGMK